MSEQKKQIFEKFIYTHKDKIYGYLFRMCGSRENADDLFQETLLKIWNKFPANPEISKIRSWIFTIAHNVLVDYYKQNKIVAGFSEDYHNTHSFAFPDDQLIGDETGRQIEEIVKSLPLKQRRALVLRVNGGLKYREIAEVMQEPLNSVISHINYALKKIRKDLEENNAA